MNNKPIVYLVAFLVFLACCLFVYGIIYASYITLTGEGVFPSFLSSSVISIAAVLSTNLGAVLGISLSYPTAINAKLWNPFAFFSEPNFTTLQITACYVYIAGLLVASVVWLKMGFVEPAADPGVPATQIVPLIPQLSKSLVGVIVGALTVALAGSSRSVAES